MRICFIGDSFVNGTGDDDCLGWVGRVCAQARRGGLDVTAYNLGVRRDTSTDIAARWRTEASARLPVEHDGRLVFSFGANDCTADVSGGTRVDIERSVALATTILGEAAAWRPTLMIGPPPVADPERNARLRRYAERMEAVCRAVDAPFLSPFEALHASGVWVREAQAGDGAHPNRGGYAILAQLVSEWPAWRAWLAASG
ncbi:MAG: GDSL-type esterase/lipase family protein [Caulobacteraceae bacterium]|nr:GDSL-type esterase/lipase family protein [Caulobacteraceae bacterium]